MEVASVEEVSSLEVGSPGKISLSEKVLLVASRRRGMYRQGGFGGLAIKVGAVKAGIVEMDSKSCYQGGYGFLKQIKGVSTSFRVDLAVTSSSNKI
jgi:hypothetical protein